MSSLSGSSNVENLSPQVLRQVAKEVAQLAKTPLEGIKVYPNEEDITDIQATVEGPAGTPYAGGHFKVRLVLGKDFPRAPPKGYFLTKVFHPNVASNGEICVNTLKRDWKSDMGLKQLLLTIKCLLIYPNPESALNEEAGKLLLEQYEDYFSRAKMMTKIHAMSGKGSKESRSSDPCSSMAGSNNLGAGSKKHAGEKKLSAVDKRKKDKKKNLKRL